MESEDDFDWEEVAVPEHEQHIEITLNPTTPKAEPANKRKSNGISYAERLRRVDCHKLHTVALLANARMRNKWINDPLLHARLISLTPLHLQNAFATIHKSRVPDQNQRGRMFEAAVRNLTEWWTSSFFDVLPEGHIRNRTYNEVQEPLISHGFVPPSQAASASPSSAPSSESPISAFLTSNIEFPITEVLKDLLDDDGEQIRSSESLMKHVLMRCGSRDTSAQLFTALCRALGIPARLVVSLQSVPWQSSVGKPKTKYPRNIKGKSKEAQEDVKEISPQISDDDEMEEIDIPTTPTRPIALSSKGEQKGKTRFEPSQGHGQHLDNNAVQSKSEKAKGKEKTKPPIKLRKQKNARPSSSTKESIRPVTPAPDPLFTPPVFWTEVFSRPDGLWLPVDPIRCIVNKRKVFDPTPLAASAGLGSSTSMSRTRSGPRQENRMVYVLAFEEDGYARDVTRRYAREYSTKVTKAQGLAVAGGGKGQKLWWEGVLGIISRPYRLHRDDVEDEELNVAQLMEGMPTTLAGFKDHPLYVLARHLKQNEVIHPPPPETPELGKFRGEPVYPRGAVISLKTAETWMRTEGRVIKHGCQALKFIKLRTSTISKMREIEVLREAGATEGNSGGGEVMQGLYSRLQTEPYVPDPVVNGKVPKNNFGNIDLYVPSMLPRGAVHVPFKGVAKVARKLGFDYAEAVTGFEFKKRRAFPVIEGIVVAQEHESTLLEAFWESERAAEEKAQAKRIERVIKRWTRLIHGLRIRQRLQNQYANKAPAEEQKNPKKQHEHDQKVDNDREPEHHSEASGGGFLVEADDVVQAFSLPRYQHVNLPFNPTPHAQQELQPDPELDVIVPEYVTYDIQPMCVDDEPTDRPTSLSAAVPQVPKTMQELAEEAAKERASDGAIERLDAKDGNNVSNTARTTQGIPPRPLRSRSRQTTPSTTRKTENLKKGRASTKRRATSDKSSVLRKRRRLSEYESDVDSDGLHIEDGTESDHDDGDDQPSPAKPTHVSLNASAIPAPSTRVLRPRKGKTPAQIEEERAIENAYRKAVAD
ncbi:hypothetical protein AX17_006728 [Amanita inopinata Kibby_2008]|nr:hypothetical protein AX17_006728 [Amanita inopinata Kibby_2008]